MTAGKMKENPTTKEKAKLDTKVAQPATVGEEAYKRLLNPDSKQGIIETQQEIDKKYFSEIEDCVRKHKGKPNFEGDFFIVVLVKKERLMENVVRRYFIARQTLPTPAFDQTVWRYRKGGELEYIWTIPDHNTCQEIFHHPEKVPGDERWLAEMVNSFMGGRLYHEACANFKIPVDVDTEKPLELTLPK